MSISSLKKYTDDFKNDPQLSALLAKQEALRQKIKRVKSYHNKDLKAFLTELEEDFETITAQINHHSNSEKQAPVGKVVNENHIENNDEDQGMNDANDIILKKPKQRQVSLIDNNEEENGPEENIPEENGPEENGPEENVPEENVPEENVPEENVPEENVPEENVPEEKSPFKKLMAQQGELVEAIKAKAMKGKQTPGPKLDQLTGKSIGTEEITLSGSKYFIRYDTESRERRKEIFLNKNDKLTLTSTEIELLDNIGITDDTYEAVRPYLYDFFEALPKCQSSIAILTNRECEVSYYVLWSVLLKARQDVQRKIDEQTQQGLMDSKLLQYEARLKSMTTRSLIESDVPKPCEESHNEHVEIEKLIKRVENKLDNVKTKVNRIKGQKGGQQSGGGLNELQRIFNKYSAK